MSKIPDEILARTGTIYIHPAVWESTCKLMEWSKGIKDAGSFFGITVRTDELLAEDQMVLLDRAGKIIYISRFGDLLKEEKERERQGI